MAGRAAREDSETGGAGAGPGGGAAEKHEGAAEKHEGSASSGALWKAKAARCRRLGTGVSREPRASQT